jgi:hypothetical protein
MKNKIQSISLSLLLSGAISFNAFAGDVKVKTKKGIDKTSAIIESTAKHTKEITEEVRFNSHDIAIKASLVGLHPGLNLEYTFPLHDYFSLSVGINKLPGTTSKEIEENGVKYNADVDTNSMSLIANYNLFPDTPVLRGLRVRAGLFNNKNEFNMTVKPSSGNITINGNDYDVSKVSANANVDFGGMTPYFGFGYGNSTSENTGLFGMNFNFDIGVIKNNASASLTSSGCTLAAPLCTNFENDIATENTSLNNELNKIDLLPVVTLGLSYSF